MSTISTQATSLSRSEWLAQAKKASSSMATQVISSIPSGNDALGASLLKSIYDSKAITSKVLNAYWERTGSEPSAPSTSTEAESNGTRIDITA